MCKPILLLILIYYTVVDIIAKSKKSKYIVHTYISDRKEVNRILLYIDVRINVVKEHWHLLKLPPHQILRLVLPTTIAA